MLYLLTKAIISLAIKGFYKKIDVYGKENLITQGPTIIIANHPSALIDPLVIATITGKRLHFIAAAEYFGKGLKSWILKHEYNMIPVYRPHIYQNVKTGNEDMFRHCFECLSDSGNILIFPEGNSVTENHLRPFKTGLARMIMGMKNSHPDLHVNVVPIGLNYTDTHKFQSDILVSIGPPVVFDNLKSTEDEKLQIQSITEQLHFALKNEITHFDNKALEPLVSDVGIFWKTELLQSLDIDKENALSSFRTEQQLISATEQMYTEKKEKLDDTHSRIKNYLTKTKAYDLPADLTLSRQPSRWLRLIIGSPFFLIGILLNGLPYLISRILFRNVYLPKVTDYDQSKGISPAFIGTMAFSVGMSIFLVWFLIGSILVGSLYYWWAAPVFFLGIYALGRFAAVYIRWAFAMRNSLKTMSVFRSFKHVLPQLHEERKDILDTLNEFLNEYRSKMN